MSLSCSVGNFNSLGFCGKGEGKGYLPSSSMASGSRSSSDSYRNVFRNLLVEFSIFATEGKGGRFL